VARASERPQGARSTREGVARERATAGSPDRATRLGRREAAVAFPRAIASGSTEVAAPSEARRPSSGGAVGVGLKGAVAISANEASGKTGDEVSRKDEARRRKQRGA